jgi:hypothetical protein
MAVEAVLGDVQAPTDEPLRERSLPFEGLFEGLAPLKEGFCLLRPEAIRSIDRLCVEPTVSRKAPKISLALESGGWLENSALSGN